MRRHVRRRARERVKAGIKSLRKAGLRHKEAVSKASKHVIHTAYRRARKALRSSKQVDRIAAYLWSQIPKRYKEGRDRVWTYVSVVALAKAIYSSSKGAGIDWRSVDWASEIDWSVGYRNALREVEKLLGRKSTYANLTPTEAEKVEREWNRVRKDLGLPETIDPWELKALFS